jgi:hypothetical protein
LNVSMSNDALLHANLAIKYYIYLHKF